MIAITSLVRNRAWILPTFLTALERLDWPSRDISILFYDDASTDDSPRLLREFADSHADTFQRVSILTARHPFMAASSSRTADNGQSLSPEDRHRLYRHLANLRNQMLELCLDYRAGMQLSIDSDILPSPSLLRALSAHEMPYVSSLILNDNSAVFGGKLDYTHLHGRLCNFAPFVPDAQFQRGQTMMDATSLLFAHQTDYPLNSLVQTGMSGAVYLIDTNAIHSGARYGFHPFGEDAWYCLELANRGIPIYCDTTVRAIHVMEQNQLREGIALWEELT